MVQRARIDKGTTHYKNQNIPNRRYWLCCPCSVRANLALTIAKCGGRVAAFNLPGVFRTRDVSLTFHYLPLFQESIYQCVLFFCFLCQFCGSSKSKESHLSTRPNSTSLSGNCRSILVPNSRKRVKAYLKFDRKSSLQCHHVNWMS